MIDLPPYTVEKKGRFHWQPNKAIRALGFANVALGDDPIAACEKARALNEQVKAERERKMNAPAEIDPTTFQHLADLFRGNEERGIKPAQGWVDLSERSREDYGEYIDRMVKMWAGSRVVDITAEVVEKWRDGMRETPYAANYALRVLSVLFGLAMRRPKTFGVVPVNPVAAVGKLGVKAGVKARRQYWTPEHEALFCDRARDADWEVFMGYSLLIYTGQRPGDVRAMTWADYDGVKIQVVQQKTGARVWIKAHRDLKTLLEEHKARRKAANRIGGTLLQTMGGEKFEERYFAERWDAVVDAIGAGLPKGEANPLAGLQRRDLRRTAVIRLAEAECTIPEIAAITGHSIRTAEVILEAYFVRTYAMAEAGITKLENHRGENPRNDA